MDMLTFVVGLANSGKTKKLIELAYESVAEGKRVAFVSAELTGFNFKDYSEEIFGVEDARKFYRQVSFIQVDPFLTDGDVVRINESFEFGHADVLIVDAVQEVLSFDDFPGVEEIVQTKQLNSGVELDEESIVRDYGLDRLIVCERVEN